MLTRHFALTGTCAGEYLAHLAVAQQATKTVGVGRTDIVFSSGRRGTRSRISNRCRIARQRLRASGNEDGNKTYRSEADWTVMNGQAHGGFQMHGRAVIASLAFKNTELRVIRTFPAWRDS